MLVSTGHAAYKKTVPAARKSWMPQFTNTQHQQEYPSGSSTVFAMMFFQPRKVSNAGKAKDLRIGQCLPTQAVLETKRGLNPNSEAAGLMPHGMMSSHFTGTG
jgi:hypothetical protein